MNTSIGRFIPDATFDETLGYEVDDVVWIGNTFWKCIDNSEGNAVWVNSDTPQHDSDDTPMSGLISINYNGLLTKVTNSELEPGTSYLINDFRTVHHILDNSTSRTGDINTGTLEPLIVKAVSTNELDKEAISTVYPKDVIYYSITSDIRDIAFYNDDQSPVTDYKGQIYFRHDTIQNVSTWYDFRNVKFRRWLVGANAWISEESYTAKDVIEYNDILYKCKVAHSGVSTTPDTDTTNWVKWLDKTINWSWTSDKTLFNVGNIITNNLTMSSPIDLFTFGDYYEHVQDVHIGRNDLSFLIDDGAAKTTLNNIVVNTVGGIPSKTSTFGELCFNNTIGDSFMYNTIGGGFISNTIGGNFIFNNIENDFKSNNIGGGFMYNAIGNRFQDNTIGGGFFSNTTGNDFFSNTIGSYFFNNQIANYFQNNTIADYFGTDENGSSFGNIIGDYFQNNTTLGVFADNKIGNMCGGNPGEGSKPNTFGDGFKSNTIGNNFFSNTIGDGFTSNTIRNDFNDNTIGYNFISNNIENDFKSNTTGDSFNSNTIENRFELNTIGNYFSFNTIKSDIADINFTPATHVYQSYDCEIFKRSGDDIRLRYTDSNDAILTVAPTD